VDKERSTEVKKGRQQFRGGTARRSNIVVVVVVVVPVDVDTVALIGVQREPRDRAALFAQTLTGPPPLGRAQSTAIGLCDTVETVRPRRRSISESPGQS
jgi:hypothetical protein